MLLPLLDRGVVYAIAHVRGGGEKGGDWHRMATFTRKRTTFADFIAVAEHLADRERITEPSKFGIEGGSAGGMLIGAVLNRRPSLFQAAVANVPAVDILQMLADGNNAIAVAHWWAGVALVDLHGCSIGGSALQVHVGL